MLRQDVKFSVPSATTAGFAQDAARQAVYELGPSVMLEAHPNYVRRGIKGFGFGWLDLARDRVLTPLYDNVAPDLVADGDGYACRFGFGGTRTFTVANCGILRDDLDGDLLTAETWTRGLLIRIPVRSGGETGVTTKTGGVPVGNRASSWTTDGNGVLINYDTGITQARCGGTLVVNNATDIADAVWHYITIAHDNALAPKTIHRRDGVQISSASSTAIPTAVGLSRELTIGGAPEANIVFCGEIAAVVHIDGEGYRAGDGKLEALEAYLAALKADLIA